MIVCKKEHENIVLFVVRQFVRLAIGPPQVRKIGCGGIDVENLIKFTCPRSLHTDRDHDQCHPGQDASAAVSRRFRHGRFRLRFLQLRDNFHDRLAVFGCFDGGVFVHDFSILIDHERPATGSHAARQDLLFAFKFKLEVASFSERDTEGLCHLAFFIGQKREI